MNEGTTKLPDDKPAEDGGELMAKEPEEFELESMFPADVLRDTEEHVFVEWLCIVAKMWGNDSPNVREKAWLRTWVKSTKEGGVAARADTSKVSVKEGEEFAEKGTEEINSDKSSMAAARLFVERPESWSIRTKSVDLQEKQKKDNSAQAFRDEKTNGEDENCSDEELSLLTTLQVHARTPRRAHRIPKHAQMKKPLTIWERWRPLFLTALNCI